MGKEEKEVIEVHIDKGMRHEQKVIVRGKADEAPGLQPGDIVFFIQEVEDETFKRKGDDLFLKKEITLAEALCGYEFLVEHMDGRVLHVQSKPGEIVRPGLIRGIEGEGMPRHKNPFLRGHLFILFDIVFPDTEDLSEDAVDSLRALLPAPAPVTVPEEAEEVSLSVDESEIGAERGHGGGGEAYDEDERGHGGGGVQCAQS